jgi:hypothetical protein
LRTPSKRGEERTACRGDQSHRPFEIVSRANELRQLIDRRLLLIDGNLRVTDGVLCYQLSVIS